MNRDHKK